MEKAREKSRAFLFSLTNIRRMCMEQGGVALKPDAGVRHLPFQ
jgi:hypothetical protein